MRKVELSLQERRRGRKKHSLTVRKVSVPKKGNRGGGLKTFEGRFSKVSMGT